MIVLKRVCSKIVIMKLSVFGVLVVLIVGAALTMFHLSTVTRRFADADKAFNDRDNNMPFTKSRKLKEDAKNLGGGKKNNTGHVNVDDYHSVNPNPSSKAIVKHGPIQHGAPIIPYIPKPTPPDHP